MLSAFFLSGPTAFYLGWLLKKCWVASLAAVVKLSFHAYLIFCYIHLVIVYGQGLGVTMSYGYIMAGIAGAVEPVDILFKTFGDGGWI